MLVGLGIAFFQFTEALPVLIVAGIFIFGQTLESYFLTPKLVGDKVGLHPVWIIFALFSGGALGSRLGPVNNINEPIISPDITIRMGK